MWKKVLGTIAVGSFLLIGASCGSKNDTAFEGTTDTKADKGLEIVGKNVQYDPNSLVNDGKPIDLEWWAWDGIEVFEEVAAEYKRIHPNVNIKVVNNPWDDYWTKLPLALNDGKGPALFNVHNSYHENIINKMEPYDVAVDALEKDFTGVETHVVDGKVYYIDYGMMTGAIYYNKDMWKEAGLTDTDIPKTWEQLEEVATKLTVKDNDKMTRAGISFNPSFESLLIGLHYQSGDNLFDSDGKTPKIDTPVMKKNFETIMSFYNKSKSANKDFGNDAGESFGQQQTAMIFGWGFMNGIFKDNYPDLNYGVFEIPTNDGEEPYAYHRYNGESTIGLNANMSDSEKEVAQDFLKFYLTNTQMQKKMCLKYSVFPANKELASDKEILAVPALQAVSKNIDRYVFPGPLPASVESNLKIVTQDVLYNGMKIDDALNKAQKSISEDIGKTNFVSVESLYKYADEVNK